MDGMSSAPTESACQISMLWNWTTVDACFISQQWHVRSKGSFAGTVIGVFFIVVALESFRRLGREYDRALKKNYAAQQQSIRDSLGKDGEEVALAPFRVTWSQQLIRSIFYGVQFATGYMLMLMAMYYNGYIIFAIFFGGFAGYLVSSSDTVGECEAPGVRGECCV